MPKDSAGVGLKMTIITITSDIASIWQVYYAVENRFSTKIKITIHSLQCKKKKKINLNSFLDPHNVCVRRLKKWKISPFRRRKSFFLAYVLQGYKTLESKLKKQFFPGEEFEKKKNSDLKWKVG